MSNKFKKGNLYLGRKAGFKAWYIIHQEGQRTWIASLFTHAEPTENHIKGNSNMFSDFEQLLVFNKEDNQSTRRMREAMFKILKWGDPDYQEDEEEETEEDDEIPDNEFDEEPDEPADLPADEEFDTAEEELAGADEGEGDSGGLQPLPTITNADVERRYTFTLSNDGERWFVRNNETGNFMNPNGHQVAGGVSFGRDKMRAYELIKRQLEKEQNNG